MRPQGAGEGQWKRLAAHLRCISSLLPADQTPILTTDPISPKEGPASFDVGVDTCPQLALLHVSRGARPAQDRQKPPCLPLSWLQTTHSLHWTRAMLVHATLPRCNMFSLPGMLFPFLVLCKVSSRESWLRQPFSAAFPSCPQAPPLCPTAHPVRCHHWHCCSVSLTHLDAPPGLHLHLRRLVCDLQHSAKYLARGRQYMS